MVLPSAYLPPIDWFVRAMSSDEPIFIEQHENFIKQTIRNRCVIDSPNGALNLSIPIDKSNFSMGKCQMKDVKISTHSDWQHQHWYALETSYFNSPFFEYLQDDFRPFYEKRWTYLMDFNEALLNKCIELIDIDLDINRTGLYLGLDINEKSIPDGMLSHSYYQVFAEKHGFLQNLSIIDLIFNMGPESVITLMREVKSKS